MKFVIRDILWFTAVIALAVVWWLDHRQQGAENSRINKQMEYYERDLMSTRSSGFAVPPGRVIPDTVNIKEFVKDKPKSISEERVAAEGKE